MPRQTSAGGASHGRAFSTTSCRALTSRPRRPNKLQPEQEASEPPLAPSVASADVRPDHDLAEERPPRIANSYPR